MMVLSSKQTPRTGASQGERLVSLQSFCRAARLASRWLWVFGCLALVAVFIFAAAFTLFLQVSVSRASLVQPMATCLSMAGLTSVVAVLVVQAGFRIRRGAEAQDGRLFASGFVPLRRLFLGLSVALAMSTTAFMVVGC